jgi:hypothetical protein
MDRATASGVTRRIREGKKAALDHCGPEYQNNATIRRPVLPMGIDIDPGNSARRTIPTR